MDNHKDLNQFGTKQTQETLKAVFKILESKKINTEVSSLSSYIKESNHGTRS